MTNYPYRLRNISRRPIELHRGGDVVVIAPGETIDAYSRDAELVLLERAGALSRHAAPEEPAAEPVEAAMPAEPPQAPRPRVRAAPTRALKSSAEKGASK